MTATDLTAALRRMDRQGAWLLTRTQLAILFPMENSEALKKSLARHCQADRLLRVAQGLYANPDARSMSAYPLESLVSYLRPLHFNYLSAETVLAERSVISQMTQNYLTVMTTGSSKRFSTPFGTVELIHTKRDHRAQRDQMHFDERRKLWVANVALAYRDLKRLGRNTSLVDEEELQEAIQEDRQCLREGPTKGVAA